jgi:hypothetical protein
LLDPATREQLTPVIELPVGAASDEFARAMHQQWGERLPFYLDLVRGRTEAQALVPSVPALTAVAESCRLRGLRMMPVISPGQSPDYQRLARELGSRAGLMLRLRVDMTVDAETLQARVHDLLESLRLPHGIVDVLLDLGHVSSVDPAPVASRMQDVLEFIADAGRWRTVIFASTSFPHDLSVASRPVSDHVTKGHVRRTDWAVWQSIATMAASGPMPLFSDYGIQHPIETAPARQGGLPLIPNIRYASDTSWLLLRGRDLHQHPDPTFRDLCRVLVAQPEFIGAAFSKGDHYLQDCADGEILPVPRSYPAWRLPGFVHHMTLVVRQLADYRSGSAARE